MVATKATAMPLPTSSILSRCCITWISPSTAPIMPIVGEKPPAASKTCARFSSRSAWLSRSSSIILRNSWGSVPSTASISDFFRKGSSICSRFWSSETMPSRRAWLAYLMISRTLASGSTLGEEKMCARRRNASSTTDKGNWIRMAPRVPPKTIMAAVGCRIGPKLPPSSSRPARIPPAAMTTPPRVALSTRLPHRLPGRLGGGHGGPAERLQVDAREDPVQHRSPEIHDALQDFLGIFPHHDLLSGDQRDDCIRGLFNELNQVRIHRQGLVVEPCQLNHAKAASLGSPGLSSRSLIPSIGAGHRGQQPQVWG